jgi:hypothetical protein
MRISNNDTTLTLNFLDKTSTLRRLRPDAVPAEGPLSVAKEHQQQAREEIFPTVHHSHAKSEPLREELEDFISAITNHHLPRVTGEHGHAAVALAYQIETTLAASSTHRRQVRTPGHQAA